MIICSPELGISPESNLGGEVHDRELLKAIDSLGVRILIILPFGKPHPVLKNGRFYYLPIPFVYPPWLFNIFIIPYLFFLYSKYHFDVLRVHSPNFVGFGALIFKFFSPKVKIVATYHHLDKKLNAIEKIAVKKFDVITTVSEDTKKELCRSDVVVIPNGVDKKFKKTNKNKKLVEEYHLSNKKVILYLGQLIERKNIPFLFRVIKRLPNSYALLICGDGPLRKKLKETAPPNVIFTGKIPEGEKVDYYNLADVFVYPSLKEGYGLSVAEAIACGKPVIASNVPIVENTTLDEKTWVKKIVSGDLFLKQKTVINTWESSANTYISLVRKI